MLTFIIYFRCMIFYVSIDVIDSNLNYNSSHTEVNLKYIHSQLLSAKKLLNPFTQYNYTTKTM